VGSIHVGPTVSFERLPAEQSLQSVGGFDRLPRAQRPILPLPKTPKGTILAHYHWESGECLMRSL